MKNRIQAIKDQINLDVYKHAFLHVVNDERFTTAPGSSTKHHNWTGGLLDHTIEVIEVALKMAEVVTVNKDVLIVAGVWHDYGKMWAYELERYYFGKFVETQSRWADTKLKSKTGGHLARSYAEFREYGNRNGLDQEFIEDVAHAILSHHQLPEWGSPVKPQTNEAWLLHLADQASAKCMGTK